MVLVKKQPADQTYKPADAPPSYAPLEPQAESSSPSRSQHVAEQLQSIPFKSKPVNYISIIRQNNPIKENFIINPTLQIPASLLIPLEDGQTEEDRKNLKLESSNSYIETDIWLVGDDQRDQEINLDNKGVPKKKRTTLDLSSSNSRVVVKMYTYTGPGVTRSPFHLRATSRNSYVTIHLPRSFQGLLTMSSERGSFKLSDELSEHVTTFNEVNDTRRCFVGDFAASGWAEAEAEGVEGWTGDEVFASSQYDKVTVQYVDEGKKPSQGSKIARAFWG